MADIKALLENFRKKREELHKLEAELKTAEARQFKVLPKEVGLTSVDALIRALARHASPRMKAALKAALGGEKPAARAAKPKPPAKARKRTRAKITDAIRAKVIGAVKAGGKTAGKIAKECGISVPSVANIKKAAGLTRKKGKK
jgi:hypothetical protein